MAGVHSFGSVEKRLTRKENPMRRFALALAALAGFVALLAFGVTQTTAHAGHATTTIAGATTTDTPWGGDDTPWGDGTSWGTDDTPWGDK